MLVALAVADAACGYLAGRTAKTVGAPSWSVVAVAGALMPPAVVGIVTALLAVLMRSDSAIPFHVYLIDVVRMWCTRERRGLCEAVACLHGGYRWCWCLYPLSHRHCGHWLHVLHSPSESHVGFVNPRSRCPCQRPPSMALFPRSHGIFELLR